MLFIVLANFDRIKPKNSEKIQYILLVHPIVTVHRPAAEGGIVRGILVASFVEPQIEGVR